MAKAEEVKQEKEPETVPDYSGSEYEGEEPPNTVPEGAPENTVASEVGITHPTIVFKGDGVTPVEAGAPDQPLPENVEPKEEVVEGSVISPAGVTPPTQVFKGDGVTPHEQAAAPDAPEAEPVNYEEHTVAELKDIAADRGIDIPSHATKAEIIEALEDADNG